MSVRHHINVLVVDDDAATCRTVQLILESHGYVVSVYNDAAEALASCAEKAYDVALVDVKMPKMSGVDFVEKLAQTDSQVTPIMMTAYPTVETAAATMRHGSRDFLAKPFRQDQLLEAIERVCQQKGLIYRSEQELNQLVGQRIRQERLSQGLSLKQLSDRTRLTTSQLSQVELGKNAASLWALARISGALGRRICELLDGL